MSTPASAHSLVPDKSLLSRYRASGDEEAFRQLADRYVPMIYASALRQVAEPAQAEDVVQAVLLLLARKAREPGWAEDTVLPGWLMRATRYECLHAKRSVARRRERESDPETLAAMNAPSLSESSPPSVIEGPDWEALVPLLDEALDSLPQADREALVLRFFDHRSLRDIGATFSIAEDAARKRVSRALEKMKTWLVGRGVTSTAASLSAVLALPQLCAAPPTLAGKMASQALHTLSLGLAPAAGTSLHSVWEQLSRATRAKVALAASALVLGSVTLIVERHFSSEKWRLLSQQLQSTATGSLEPISVPPPTSTPATSVTTASAATTAQILQDAIEAFSQSRQSVTTMTTALAHLARLQPSEVPEALKLSEKVPDLAVRKTLLKFLLARWAEHSPDEALDYMLRVMQPSEASITSGLLGAWSSHNMESAMMWFSKSPTRVKGPPPGDLMDSNVVQEVFRGLAVKDIDSALVRVTALPTETAQSHALEAIAGCLKLTKRPEEMMAMAEKLPKPELRLLAQRALVERWADIDPEATAAWIKMVANPWDRSKLMDSLGLAWLQKNPATAANWWIEQAPGAATLTKIMNVWTLADPNAAGQWLAYRGQGPEGDTARMTFARMTAEIDGESAVRWAGTLHDAGLRQSTEDYAASLWLRREPDAATNFLQRTQWDAERIARLASGGTSAPHSPPASSGQ